MEGLSIPTNVFLSRLVPLVSQDAEVVAILRGLAQEFLNLTEVAAPEVAAPVAAPTVAEFVITEPPVPEFAVPTVQHAPLPSASGIEIPVGWFRRLIAAESDLQVIEARCRLKAEGARWAAARQRSLQDGANFYTEIEPKDREIISKAKGLEDCFLWMNHSSAPIPANPRLWDDVAGASRRRPWQWPFCGK